MITSNKQLAEQLIKSLQPTTSSEHDHFTGEFLDLIETYFNKQ